MVVTLSLFMVRSEIPELPDALQLPVTSFSQSGAA